jgi:F-type H+-transporting ATPase subunit delta
LKDTVAARKYAKALFLQAQSTNQVLACQQGLDEVERIIGARESLRRILSHPFIVSQEKQKLIHSVLGEYATPLLERFLNLLIQKRRFDLLPVVVQEFRAEVDASQNIRSVAVATAYPMNEAQTHTIKQKLETWLHAKVRMNLVVNPELMGGLVIRTSDQECDQSLRTQLRRLQTQLEN